MLARSMKATSRGPSRIREPPTSFVGREEDLRAIDARFEEGARLVTLVAPGGMGKTRLATRYARRADEAKAREGAVIVANISTEAKTANDVAACLGEAMGVARVGESGIERVGRALAKRTRPLVVLDNFEHVAAHASATIGAWLHAAPFARFLVTSRVVLGVSGEHVLELLPLPCSNGADRASPAVDLFLRRARAARSDFDPSPSELAVVAEIVRALEGVPLAIELAAARVAALSLDNIRRRASTPLALLSRRDGEGKHASMRRVIADSVEQLPAAARRAFAAAAVFHEGFTMEAAERVLGDAADAIEVLVSRSLLRATRLEDGEVRYGMYEAIAELAREELATLGDDARALELRHMQLFASFAAEMRGRLEAASDPSRCFELLARERSNLFAAHARAVALGEATAAIEIARALDAVSSARGEFSERWRVLDEALRCASPGTGDRCVAAALTARGHASRELGDLEAATRDHRAARELAERSGDDGLACLARARLAEIVETNGALEDARAMLVEALSVLERVDGASKERIEAEVRARLGHVHRREGRLDEAEREIDRAVFLRRRAARGEELAMALYEAAVVSSFRGRADEALARYEESLDIVRCVGARQAEGAILSGIGVLLQETGRLDEALAKHAEAAVLFREIGNRHREASALYYLGGAYLERGAFDDAEEQLTRSRALFRRVGVPRYEALVSSCLASLAADRKDDASARAWLEEAKASARTEEPSLFATLSIHALHVEVEAARVDRDEAARRARSIAAHHAGDDPRFALRVLELAPSTGKRGAALAIEARGRVRLPDGSSIDLAHRAPLRRIVEALGRRRADAPGEPLSIDAVVEAGWPTERMSFEAAANRGYVALATLRKLGLRRYIVRIEGGWALDPSVPFEARS